MPEKGIREYFGKAKIVSYIVNEYMNKSNSRCCYKKSSPVFIATSYFNFNLLQNSEEVFSYPEYNVIWLKKEIEFVIK